ncbi:glycoside hydrolase family 71/99-like protein [Deminuibacter soli]|uniref:Xylosidase n=1 Tax=Deminuibacter soli TaxID=2291815 RepID=A0A3E1NKM5_9BACT|nr:glycoside hydrolase family 71/99-like protein [Deminuibacter soli]RFM28499.1 xylosidase [Deminuibacter soli]
MKQGKWKLTALALCATLLASAQVKHSSETLYPTYKGLVMAGYQGWFRAAGDASGSTHYVYGDEHRSGIDVWPDVSEYEKTYATTFTQQDGKPARFFSSYDKSTVDLHFKWMQQYGVDGVFMQRFFDNTREGSRGKQESSVILQNAMDAASKYKRAIAVMYDLSGLHAKGEDCSAIMEDWKYLVDQLKVTSRANNTYLQENGKPVVAIWGIGFPDRPYDIRNIGLERLIDFLHNDPVYGHCTVLLGVPNSWRELNADCIHDPYLHGIIKQADIILPWSVQRFSPLLHNDMDRFRDQLIADMDWCRQNKIQYVPCVYPGFSWHNLSMHEFPDDIKPVGSIPRQRGRFYWQMLSTAIQSGAEMLYVAMFDEVNEGTAIFKCSDNPPQGKEVSFLSMEGVPNDLYLKLTGEAAKMLRREKPLQLNFPAKL